MCKPTTIEAEILAAMFDVCRGGFQGNYSGFGGEREGGCGWKVKLKWSEMKMR